MVIEEKIIKLEYKKICKDNIIIATKIQYEIFPNSSAYTKYLDDIKDSNDLPINFLVYYQNEPIGVVGLYDIPKYKDTIWLSWFGVIEKYRYKGFGLQILKDIIIIAKEYNKKFLRLFTYEVWNEEAQKFYKKHMEIEEYYTNSEDDQYDIEVGKCKIFGYSLCDEKIGYWDNKFIDIANDDNVHEESIILMKKDGIIK